MTGMEVGGHLQGCGGEHHGDAAQPRGGAGHPEHVRNLWEWPVTAFAFVRPRVGGASFKKRFRFVFAIPEGVAVRFIFAVRITARWVESISYALGDAPTFLIFVDMIPQYESRKIWLFDCKEQEKKIINLHLHVHVHYIRFHSTDIFLQEEKATWSFWGG